jgi:hypothetical protein
LITGGKKKAKYLPNLHKKVIPRGIPQKGDGAVTQTVEHLPNEFKPSTEKKKKKKNPRYLPS